MLGYQRVNYVNLHIFLAVFLWFATGDHFPQLSTSLPEATTAVKLRLQVQSSTVTSTVLPRWTLRGDVQAL